MSKNNNNDSLVEFGKRLRFAREAKKVSRQALAKQIGVAVSTLQKYEDGGDPKGSVLSSISYELGVSIDWLLLGNEKALNNVTSHYSDTAAESILDNAIARSGYNLTSHQKKAIISLIREELEGKTLKMISALKGGNNYDKQ